MTTNQPSPSEIAIRIATAMGWKRGRDYDRAGINDSLVILTFPLVNTSALWSPAESAHDAVDLLEMLPAKGMRCLIDSPFPNEWRVTIRHKGREGVHAYADASLARAIAIVAMNALELK